MSRGVQGARGAMHYTLSDPECVQYNHSKPSACVCTGSHCDPFAPQEGGRTNTTILSLLLLVGCRKCDTTLS